MSQFEIDYLLSGKKPTEAIVKKAVDHARMRIDKGLSPFKEVADRDTLRKESMDELAEEIGPLQAFLIGTGKGFYNIGRGLGITEPPGETEAEAMTALKKERPYTTGAGEIVGEAAPFLIPGTVAGRIASVPLRVLASGAVGGAEGGIISRGIESDVAAGVGMGTTIGVGAEILFPVLGKLGRKIFQRVTGRVPTGAILDAAGKPTQELKEALDAAGMSFEDLTEDAAEVIMQQTPGAKTEQVARAALFTEEGIPATRGEITKGYEQLATEQRLIESVQDTAAEPLRQFKLKQSEAIKENLRTNLGETGKEETGELIHDALVGRKKLLRTQKNELYETATENAKEIGGVPIFIDNLKEAIPDADLFEDLIITAPQGMKSLDQILTKYGIKDPSAEALEKGFQPTPLTVGNFERFRKTLNAIERGDTTGAVSVAIRPIKEALDNEVDNLVETLTNRAGLREHKGKLIYVDKLRAELDNNSKLIGFIKKRTKAESIAPDTKAMAKALKERGIPTMQQIRESKSAFANRIEGDFKRIFKSDPILKNLPEQVITDPKLQQLTTRNAEITQIIDQSRSKIPNEIIDKVLKPLKEARKRVRTLKTEFSPQSTIGRIIDTKKDGITQITEASKVYDKLVGRTSPVENTRKLIKSLIKSGDKGKQAISSIQATTIMDLIDAGFGTESRKISGVKVFNPIAFKNRIKNIGPDKLKSLFANEKQVLKKLNNIEKIATELVPPSGAVPKGSASVVMDLANSLGLVGISHKMPGGALLIGALKALADPVKKGVAVKKAMKAVPEVEPARLMIEQQFSGLASALGIAAIIPTEEKK